MSTDAVGGVWTYATELRAALRARGVEVVLATLGPEPPPEDGVAWMPCRLEWEEDPWDDVRASGAWLRELAAAERADLAHLNGFAHGQPPWALPVVVVAHSCVLSWHEAVRGGAPGPELARYREEVAKGLRGADVVVAPTAATGACTHRLYGLEQRCRVIPNGVAPRAGEHCEKRRIVLAAGRLWDEAKGLEVLDRAAERISWPVHVAGETRGARAEGVRLLGPLDRGDLRRRMGEAAIFAHPARYEPFGLAVLEAAMEGCALVLGDIPTLREQWDSAALFVAPGDPVALAQAVERLAEDEQLRLALAARARRRAECATASAMARSYADLYRRAVARRAVAA